MRGSHCGELFLEQHAKADVLAKVRRDDRNSAPQFDIVLLRLLGSLSNRASDTPGVVGNPSLELQRKACSLSRSF
jgi:hypothetical protein